MLREWICLQVTFPIRPDRVQDSSYEMSQNGLQQDAGKVGRVAVLPPADSWPVPDSDASRAMRSADRATGPGSRLPPLARPSSGRPRQAPEDFLHLFGKKGGKLPMQPPGVGQPPRAP